MSRIRNDEHEISCLEIVRNIKHYDDLVFDSIEDVKSERPDFMIGNVGLEHFCVDYLVHAGNGSKYESECRKLEHLIKNSCADFGNGSAAIDKQYESFFSILNKSLPALNNVSYVNFISHFVKVCFGHLFKVKGYQASDKCGFLIEMLYPLHPLGYLVYDSGLCRCQRVQTMPITRIMIQLLDLIQAFCIVDFLIFCVRPGMSSNGDVLVFRLDFPVVNIEREIRRQGGFVCDMFELKKSV